MKTLNKWEVYKKKSNEPLRIDPNEPELMYHYSTRGRGWEEDEGIDRGTFFHILEEVGQEIYGLSEKESKELADVFWFGGVGYIGGWATVRMMKCASANFNQLKYEDRPGRYVEEIVKSCSMPGGLTIGVNRHGSKSKYYGQPERRWFIPSMKMIVESEDILLTITGKMCICDLFHDDVYYDKHFYETYHCFECLRVYNRYEWRDMLGLNVPFVVKCKHCGKEHAHSIKKCRHRAKIHWMTWSQIYDFEEWVRENVDQDKPLRVLIEDYRKVKKD